MKIITTSSLLFLLCACNNSSKEDATMLQHRNDSLQAVIKLQSQQRQIDSLKAEVSNVAHATSSMEEANEEKQKEMQERRRKALLSVWKYQLEHWNTQLDVDKANLNWASSYHIGRLESTKNAEIQQASQKMEQDKINIQKCQDSVSKYQN